jgi:hypothetical protein
MNKYNIKILENTPIHSKYTIISIEDFRKFYPTIINEHNSNEFLINYLKQGYKNDNLDIDYSKWFEVIEIKRNNFKVGDWVWHEGEKQAFTIVHWTVNNSFQKEWKPNYISLEAANNSTETYKRLATQEEIKYYNLHSFCDGHVLIGEYKCYYFNNVWKDLIGIHKNITKYLEYQKEFFSVSTLKQFSSEIENSFDCKPNGLKVGCKEVLHEEIIQIAKILKLM